jgi:hypothetical protein
MIYSPISKGFPKKSTCPKMALFCKSPNNGQQRIDNLIQIYLYINLSKYLVYKIGNML